MARSRRLLGAVAVAVAIPSIVACNAILGLDQFEKGECPGARCGDGGLPDGAAEASPDVVVDAPSDAPRGADPVSWAQWPMPNYDAGAGVLPRPTSYQSNGPDVVTDVVTGLVWRTTTLPQMTEQEALDACKVLDQTTGPWRLPKRIEVVTLLDYGRSGALIDPTAFPGVKNVRVWTSSEQRPYTGGPDQGYWTVNFDDGRVEPKPGTLVANVLCVKAK